MLSRIYEDGREQAELGLRSFGEVEAIANMPATCPYTLDEIFRRGWYPDPAGDKP